VRGLGRTWAVTVAATIDRAMGMANTATRTHADRTGRPCQRSSPRAPGSPGSSVAPPRLVTIGPPTAGRTAQCRLRRIGPLWPGIKHPIDGSSGDSDSAGLRPQKRSVPGHSSEMVRPRTRTAGGPSHPEDSMSQPRTTTTSHWNTRSGPPDPGPRPWGAADPVSISPPGPAVTERSRRGPDKPKCLDRVSHHN
jgi:hypothetical protein